LHPYYFPSSVARKLCKYIVLFFLWVGWKCFQKLSFLMIIFVVVSIIFYQVVIFKIV
jgi:hypothetical protein